MQQIDAQKFVLKTFQLKAARAIANMELRTIGKHLGVTAAAISLWEKKNNFTQLTTSNENILILKEVFAAHNIFFPSENSVAVNEEMKERRTEGLTRFQLKAARAMLNISQERLVESLNVSTRAISRTELSKNYEYMRSFDKKLPMILKNWFENRGIIFEDDLTISFFKKKMC